MTWNLFQVIRPRLAYSIKIKPRKDESQTKYIFTNWLKQLLVSTRFIYPSSVLAQKEAKLKSTNYKNSSKSPNNISTFFTSVHFRMLYVLRLLTAGWQTRTDRYWGVMLWPSWRRFGFLISGRKFWRKKICVNHRDNCVPFSQLRITIAQFAVRFCQLLTESRYVLHSLEQTFMFPVSADSLIELCDLDLYCYIEKHYVSSG